MKGCMGKLVVSVLESKSQSAPVESNDRDEFYHTSIIARMCVKN